MPKLASSQYRILGVQFSSKSWIYLLSAQLMLNQGLSSALPCAAGLLAGQLYDRDGFGLQSARLPKIVETPFRLLGTAVGGLIPSLPAQPAMAPQPGQRLTPAQNMPAPAAGNAQLRNRTSGRHLEDAPSEESIALLVGMGFERTEVVAALRATGNNADAAANMLLR